jgi:hypothetical protein
VASVALPGLASQMKRRLSPTCHVSPIALSVAGSISLDATEPRSVPKTFIPEGRINSRCSPIRHSGRRTSSALGGGNFINMARAADPEVGTGAGVSRGVGAGCEIALFGP